MPAAGSLLLFTNGIPIAPADLDFGNTVTQNQINALSRFSQMVNAIPATSTGTWVPGGSRTWDIYQLILTLAEFATGAKAQPPPVMPSIRAFSRDDGESIRIAAFTSDSTPTAAASDTSALHDALEQCGFTFSGRLANPYRLRSLLRERALSVAPPPPAAPPAGLASLFLQLKAQFTADQLTDTLGASFYPTPCYPPDFYTPAYDASWQPFEVAPGQGNPWVPGGGRVTGDMIAVTLQRAWWSPWVFSSQGWRFTPAAGLGYVSDGMPMPTGLMPAYATEVLIARNVRVIPAGGTAAAAPATNPFAIGAAPPSPPATTGTVIIAFACSPVPRCPDPSPSLSWP
jgi:hypothetical protein